MDQGRTVKKIFESKPEGTIRRFRWLEGVEKDLWEMQVKRWRQQAGDREEWTFVFKQVKALRGP